MYPLLTVRYWISLLLLYYCLSLPLELLVVLNTFHYSDVAYIYMYDYHIFLTFLALVTIFGLKSILWYKYQFSHSVMSDSLQTRGHQAFLSITNSWSLLKLISIKSVMPSNHLTLCHPLLLMPSVFPSIRIFSNESVLRIGWPKYSSFNHFSEYFSISRFSEYSGLISFRVDWFDLLVAQGALKSLLQHHSSKASILQRSGFFLVQLSHLYVITGKTVALTRRTSVSKVTRLWN